MCELPRRERRADSCCGGRAARRQPTISFSWGARVHEGDVAGARHGLDGVACGAGAAVRLQQRCNCQRSPDRRARPATAASARPPGHGRLLHSARPGRSACGAPVHRMPRPPQPGRQCRQALPGKWPPRRSSVAPPNSSMRSPARACMRAAPPEHMLYIREALDSSWPLSRRSAVERARTTSATHELHKPPYGDASQLLATVRRAWPRTGPVRDALWAA